MSLVCSALAIAAELSLSAFSATAALTGAATLALMRDMASRSGSSSPDCCSSSSSLTSGVSSSWVLSWSCMSDLLRFLGPAAGPLHDPVVARAADDRGPRLVDVGRDHPLDVAGHVESLALGPELPVDYLAYSHGYLNGRQCYRYWPLIIAHRSLTSHVAPRLRTL